MLADEDKELGGGGLYWWTGVIVEKPGRVGRLRALEELEKTSKPVYASVSVGKTVAT